MAMDDRTSLLERQGGDGPPQDGLRVAGIGAVSIQTGSSARTEMW